MDNLDNVEKSMKLGAIIEVYKKYRSTHASPLYVAQLMLESLRDIEIQVEDLWRQRELLEHEGSLKEHYDANN